jgi:hypothetical protein
MNNFERFIIDLLQDNIIYDNKIVEVRRSFLPSAELPCITLDLQGDEIMHTFRTFENTEKFFSRINGNIKINTWCNDEQARESINNQIQECFIKASNHHYIYCTNYNDGNCTTLGKPCQATTINTSRTIKYKCPDPDANNYQSLFSKHMISDGTCVLEPAFFIDEINEHPPILHSVLKIHCEYMEQLSDLGTQLEGFDGYDINID